MYGHVMVIITMVHLNMAKTTVITIVMFKVCCCNLVSEENVLHFTKLLFTPSPPAFGRTERSGVGMYGHSGCHRYDCGAMNTYTEKDSDSSLDRKENQNS